MEDRQVDNIPQNKHPIRVQVVGANGEQITSFGGGGDVTISGEVEVKNDAGNPVPVSATSLPLPTGASTAANQATGNASLSTIATNIGTTGASAKTVQGNSASGATDVGDPVKTGGVQMTTQPTLTDGQRGNTQMDTRGNTKVTLMTMDSANQLTTASTNSDTVATSATSSRLQVNALGLSFDGTNYNRDRVVANGTNSTGTGIKAAGLVAQLDDVSPTAITENQFGNVRISQDRSLLVTGRSTTPAQTSVASSASSVSLLAANSARKGAVITNDSSAVLYLKLGTTASTSSYTVTLAGAASPPFASYEVPFDYVGAVDGIWASANGNARITELT